MKQNFYAGLKFKYYFLVLSMVCQFSLVLAQDSAYKVNIVSPTASSLGKYGDIPVSYNTGVPNVSIPIYTVKSGSLELPISLSYHASGLKVQEQAGWTGAGWSLNAGGVITRTVIGQPDDRGYNSTNVSYGYYSDYGYSSYALVPCAAYSNPSTGFNLAVDDVIGFDNGTKDGEPDLYFFNFGGYSGKFYFNDDRTPIFVPEQDFKVQTDWAPLTGFNGFIVTTTDGVRYYFGGTGNDNPNVNPFEISTPTTVQSGPAYASQAATAWYLNKIVSADGIDSINLIYTKESYSDYSVSMFPIQGVPSSPPVYSFTSANGYNLIKNFIQGVRLSQVTCPNGIINLNPAATSRQDLSGYNGTALSGMYDAPNTYSTSNPNPAFALGSISVANNNGVIKKDTFYYHYFFDSNPIVSGISNLAASSNIQSDAYRLCLDSVQEQSGDGSITKPAYKFNYFSELVPRKLSFGMDHWGFYNGASNNLALIPTYTVQNGNTIQTVAGATRDAAWPAMRGGALQQITYPTGGSTQFVYGPNDTYASYNSYIKNNRTSVSVLYDGSTSNTISFTTSATSAGNVFELDIPSSAGITANIEFFNGTTIVGNYSAAASTFLLSANTTYKIEIFGQKASSSTSSGVTATLSEWVPTLIQGNTIVGGLRIDSIINNDGVSGNPVITSYNYAVTGGTKSTGILYSKPVYVQAIRNDFMEQAWPIISVYGCPLAGGSANSFFASPGAVLPMTTVQGNHIGYNQVTVSQSGNGSSIYQYYGSNVWDNNNGDVCTRFINTTTCTSSIPSYPYAPLPFDYMRGELKEETHLNQAGAFLKDVLYYHTYQQDSITTPAFIAAVVSFANFNVGTLYQLQSAYKIKDSVATTDYDPLNKNQLTTTSTAYYGSKYHHEPTQKIATNSIGDLLKANIEYAFDYCLPVNNALSDGTSVYNAAVKADSIALSLGLQNAPAQTCACFGNQGNQNQARYDTLQKFRIATVNARIAYIKQRLTVSNQFTTNHTTAKTSADASLKPVLQLQDEYMNVPIEQGNWKNSNLLNAHYTNYGFVTNPAGYVYAIGDKTLTFSSPSSSFIASALSGSSIITDSRYLPENTVNYNGGRIADVTGKNGITTAYLYGYSNQYQVAKIVGATYAQSSAAVIGTTIANPATADVDMRKELSKLQTALPLAMASTYTYAPLIGMTSETDAQGRSTYYNYDGLQRLSYVQDQDKNVVKRYAYNYTGQSQNNNVPGPYANAALASQTFTKTGCAVGTTAPTYNYAVPAGKYTSFTDGVVNPQALNDLNTYGQAGANALPCIASISALNATTMPFTIVFTNTSSGTSTSYTSYNGSSSSVTLGNLPVGTYNIAIAPNSSYTAILTLNGSTYTSTSFSLSNIAITTATNIVLQPQPVSASCSFIMASGYSSPTNSITSNGTTASGYLTFYSFSTMSQGTTYTIATINGSCKPSSARYLTASSGGKTFALTFNSNGSVTVQLVYGATSLNSNTTVSLSFSCNL